MPPAMGSLEITKSSGRIPRMPPSLVARRSPANCDLISSARSFLDAGIDLGFWHAAVAQAIGHVVVDAHMRIECIVLKHHGDVAIGRLDLVDDAPADVDVAAGDGLEPRHHTQQRGLAAAGGADQHAELAAADLEVDALDGLDATGIGRVHVADGDVSNGNAQPIANGE